MSHAPMSWLKAEALRNIDIVVTSEVPPCPVKGRGEEEHPVHVSDGWLKCPGHHQNMAFMSFTKPVSHAPMSSSKAEAYPNM